VNREETADHWHRREPSPRYRPPPRGEPPRGPAHGRRRV